MFKINLYMKTVVMATLFAFIAIGNINAQTDNRLNGRWVLEDEEETLEYRFNNSNVEALLNGVPHSRGTYTTTNREITFDYTHFWGGGLGHLGKVLGLEAKWYSKNEIIILATKQGAPESSIKKMMMITIGSHTYSVDAKSLILSDEEGTLIFNKK